MATYFNDCSALTGWTEEELVGTTQFTDAGSTITASTTSIEYLTRDEVGSDADRDDVEILIKVKSSTLNGTAYVAQGRFTHSGTVASTAGYFVAVRSTALRTYYKQADGSITQIDSTTISALSNDTYYWVRLRINGTTVQARYWADGGSENTGAWTCEETGISYVTGVGDAGLVSGTTTSTITWAAAGFGTNGDTAPASAPATTVVKDMIGAGFIAFAR